MCWCGADVGVSVARWVESEWPHVVAHVGDEIGKGGWVARGIVGGMLECKSSPRGFVKIFPARERRGGKGGCII